MTLLRKGINEHKKSCKRSTFLSRMFLLGNRNIKDLDVRITGSNDGLDTSLF